MSRQKNNKTENGTVQFYERAKCKTLCYQYNRLAPDMMGARLALIKRIFGATGSMYLIEQPFMCDYGYNIKIGESFYANHNLLILDGADVTFGDNVLIGPNCSFYTTMHPLDVELRKSGVNNALPIFVGDNVWIGGGVTVLPGVTIGENSVIGACSVVNKDIPPNVLAVGNPCEVIKKLEIIHK